MSTENISVLISGNKDQLRELLRQSMEVHQLHGLGRTAAPSTQSFDSIDERYNKNISHEEKQAWVWYKLKNNLVGDRAVFEQSGWKKYIIPKSEEATVLPELVRKGVLFYCNRQWLPFPMFTYGNMYDRILSLEADKDYIISQFGEDVYNEHKRIVDAAKPRMLTVTNPDPKERPIITAISRMANKTSLFSIKEVREECGSIDDVRELTMRNGRPEPRAEKDVRKLTLDGNTEYSLVDVFTKWLYSLNQDRDFEKSSAAEVVDYYLKNKALRNDKLEEEAKAEIKMQARLEGEKLFSRFLYEALTFDDQQRLDFTWNRIYNGHSDMNYLKVPVGFECSTHFKTGILQITDAQRQGIAFQEAMGTGINAFDVGVGKTMTAICTLAQMIYSGKSKRALIVVPKPTYEKWIAELVGVTDRRTNTHSPGVLSGTGITLNEWENLGTSVLRRIDTSKAAPERSITLVTYEGFKRIGFGDTVSNELFEELVDILEQNSGSKTDREKEKETEKYQEMLGIGNKNSVLDIDKIGFDYVVIDEAHRCKNVFSSVKADEDGNKRYQIQSSVSETGQKAFFLLTYLQRTYGRNIMLLTATPFTNSPLEVFSMLSLVAYDSLRNMGISNIRDFFDLFVLPTVEYAANYKEEIKLKEVIKAYTNRIVLSRLIYNHILYKSGEDAGVLRPVKVNLPLIYEYEDTDGDGKKERLPADKQALTYIRMNASQRNNQDDIVTLAKQATAGQLQTGNLMRALGRSLDNALSPFLYKFSEPPEDYKEFVEYSPKIKYVMDCVASVKSWHEKRQEQVSGQVIYMNRGKVYFPLIKEFLENEVGFRRDIPYDRGRLDEVEIISSDIDERRKEAIKEAFLDGVVKIIIGTATIREGIDLQKRGTVIYNCYPEWNPTDIRQLEGRIWRQGNMFKYVRVVMPLVQDSMDVFVFQKLEEKTARINDIWAKADRGNVLDLESLDPNEVKLALISDVDRLVRMYFEQEFADLRKQYNRTLDALRHLQIVERDIKMFHAYRETLIATISKYKSSLSISRYATLPVKPEPGAERDPTAEARYKNDKTYYDKAIELIDHIAQFETAAVSDKEILATARKIQSANGGYFNLQFNSYAVDNFKEYLSKVAKFEATFLTPKGFTLASDLTPVTNTYEKELAQIELVSEDYKKGAESIRWQQLAGEIALKKAKLKVDGRSPEERAQEFANLNYLLEARAIPPKQEKKKTSSLKLKALALEMELELLMLKKSAA